MDSSGTEGRLRAHVEALAGTIGERHFLRPRALAAAADYIEAEWRAQGYVPERETFTLKFACYQSSAGCVAVRSSAMTDVQIKIVDHGRQTVDV